jgi:L-ascorbate metabolism protein UlaG (beta-lactamase superfamily)
MAKTQLTWFGQSTFKIVTPNGNVLLIDPWLTNPKNPNGESDLGSMTRVDLILLTHGHADHVGNSVEIATRTRATLVTNLDLSTAMISVLGYPESQATAETNGHIGGTISLLDGGVKVTIVPAFHGSFVQKDENSPPVYAGNPTGLVIEIKNGPTIYHTGDTDVFSDMALIPQFHKIDIMLACIGDHFTMGPAGAALATKLVKPKTVVPMHFATFPVLTGTPESFDAELKKQSVKTELRLMKIGETITLGGS